jgi:endoglucanase
MKHHGVWLALLAACGPGLTPMNAEEASSELPWDAAGPPALDLSVIGDAAPGEVVTLELTLPQPITGITTYFPVSWSGVSPDAGPCPGAFRGDCVDLEGPLDLYGPVTSVQGVSTIDITVPANATEGFFAQAGVVRNGNGFLSNTVALLADLDLDGVPAPDDCDDSTADLGAQSDDADCDGVVTGSDCDDGDPSVGSCGEGWRVEDGRIYYGSEERVLRGVNWFGLDSTDHALHGLWAGVGSGNQAASKIDHFLDLVDGWGFTALRIPLSPESLAGAPTQSWGQDPLWSDSRGQLEYLLEAAAERDLWVLLDMHTCAASAGHLASGPEACGGYSYADWLADLGDMADLSLDHPNVVGIDLFNEPYGLTWDDWRGMVNDGADVVLARNPEVLVFVEGVGGSSAFGSANPFYGENLFEALSNPVSVPESQLVFTPHVYGPSVYDQDYFSDAAFPQNMPPIWDEHFGFLRDEGYVLAPGEFGGRYTGADATWQDAFIDYLVDTDIQHFFYWCLNPNSGDTGGLLLDDWITPHQEKLDLLEPLLTGN